MKHVIRNYALELYVVLAGLAVSIGSYMLFDRVIRVRPGELAYASIASAGLLFIAGHIYSRLKERRDAKRKRAQELFLEWHSKDIRESRMFISRWRAVHPDTTLPSLGLLEKQAADSYRMRYERSLLIATAAASDPTVLTKQPVDDPEQKELHFFRIYQFFERWALLVHNADLDHRAATEYMSSYKGWYFQEFLEPWHGMEENEQIRATLSMIIATVKPPK